jgi:putative sterol carrier protein
MFKMTDIMAQAVEAIEKKLEGTVFDGSAKFEIEGQGSVIIDASGVRVSDDETEVTLSANLETFQEILEGDLDSTAAFMTGRLKLDGDMSTAMRLASVLS